MSQYKHTAMHREREEVVLSANHCGTTICCQYPWQCSGG